MRDTLCPVRYNREVAPAYFTIGLETGWPDFIPGQFGMLEVPPGEGILLRRPFSFARQIGPVTEILYKVVGKGTRALAKVGTDASLRLLGPLGNGFSLSSGPGDWVGVAGGYGIAPFLQMGRLFAEKGKTLSLFYGARSKIDLVYLQELNTLNLKLYITTEDGSEGRKGRVTELLDEVYRNGRPSRVASCGPTGLLRAVQAWGESHGVECELSVEETMGCGTGVCLGCVVKDRAGHYRRACVEGPIFRGEFLDL